MKIAVFTGAGISRESGLKTFRDSDGLWEGHRVEDVATPEAWHRDAVMVNEFYNMRRRDVLAAQPNDAHRALGELEERHEVTVITQNIDDLHERGGSRRVIHLHGEVLKVRDEHDEGHVVEWNTDLAVTDLAPSGGRLRPHVVWFGEGILGYLDAYDASMEADVMIVVGTSLQVYPAAHLAEATRAPRVILVDPKPPTLSGPRARFEVIAKPASEGVREVVNRL